MIRRVAVLLLGFLPALLAAGPPEVVRLRVPAAKVPAVFPPGTDLRVLSPSDFESLVKAAAEGFERNAKNPTHPRPLRAKHSAKWDAGVLVGTSEILIEGMEHPTSRAILEPWGTAIDASRSSADVLQVGVDQKLGVKVMGATPSTVMIGWEQAARPGSQGRGFDIELPGMDTSSFVLDVPAELIPEMAGRLRQGPSAGSANDRRSWRFDGPGGMFRLRLANPAASNASGPSCWVSGTTRIDVSESPARWQTDWLIEPISGGSGRMEAELPSGLELIDVSGPLVASYRVDPASDGRKTLSIRLMDAAAAPSTLSIRALAKIPEEGPWEIPAAKPIHAAWIGGRTLVRLHPSQAVSACRLRAGRQVSPHAEELELFPRGGTVLAFEATSPAPVADVTIGRPTAIAAAEVRGLLLLGRDAPRIETQITWRVDRGKLFSLAVDLAAGWTPERVQFQGSNAQASWHIEPRTGGGSRLAVHAPPTFDPMIPIVLNISAVSSKTEPMGIIDLPRVAPPVGGGVRIFDEVWVAKADAGIEVAPVRARGLAWIDPATVPFADSTSDAMKPVLAWRWTAGDGRASVSRSPLASRRELATWTVATISAERLIVEWYVAVSPSEAGPAEIVVATNESIESKPKWQILADSSRDVDAVAVPSDELAAFGLSPGASAWRLAISGSRRESRIFRAKIEGSWSGDGVLPLIRTPSLDSTRSSVLLNVDRALRPIAKASGMQRWNPPAAAAQFAAAVRVGTNGAQPARPAMAFGYGANNGSLRIRTESLPISTAGGVIEEASLSTRSSGNGPVLQRLALRVVPGLDRSLEVRMPVGTLVERAEIDGQPIALDRRNDRLSIPMPGSSRSLVDLKIDYQAQSSAAKITADRPEFSMPCLGFLWEIDAPSSSKIAAFRGDLRSADFTNASAEDSRLTELFSWSSRRSSSRGAETLRTRESRMGEFNSEGMTLGECLLRLDTASPPLVIDRHALQSLGLGTQTILGPVRGRSSQSIPESLAGLGLVLEPRDAAILVTSESLPSSGQMPETEAAFRVALRQAVSHGGHSTDRYLSVPRWCGEPTPTSRSIQSPPGSVRNYVAPTWPNPRAEVQVVDVIQRSFRAWALGLSTLLAGVVLTRRSARKRAVAILLVLAPAWLLSWWNLLPSTQIPQAIFWAGLALSAFWFGHALPSPRPRSMVPSRAVASSLSRRSGVSAVLILGFWILPAVFAIDVPSPESPIIAVFPYDPPLNMEKAGEVILRLSDFDRLKKLAETPQMPSETAVGTLSAEHVVQRHGPRDFQITSTFALESEGPSSWSFPIEGEREIVATLDGQKIPIQIEPGAKTASIPLASKGRHGLSLRALAEATRVDDEDVLRWRVPPIPASRIAYLDASANTRIVVTGARGPVERNGDRFSGLLGPVGDVEIRWLSEPDAKQAAPRGELAAIALWDVEPAGDRVLMRVSSTSTEPLCRLALRLEPGVLVRSSSFQGGADPIIKTVGSEQSWEAAFLPPLEPGEAVSLEFWRPLANAKDSPRRMPQIQPTGIASLEWIVGVRRPEDWVGRVASNPGQEVLVDEAFARTWGPLPAGSKTLAGAVQSTGWSSVSVATGPSEDRPIVTPRAQLALSSGRLDVKAEAQWAEASGRSRQVEVAIPSDLRVTHIEADGLTDWSRPSDDRLRFRFDGPNVLPTRRAVIEGWVPIDNDPMAAGPAMGEVAVPWPVWVNMTTNPGDLQIQAPTNLAFRLDMLPGVVPLPPRGSYRIPSGSAPGRLTWTVEPVGVSVLVQGAVTILPDAAEWTASARYRIPWGPCPPVQLLVPSDWADVAQVEIVGSRVRPDVEKTSKGTIWTFRPDPAIWGSLQVVVRATKSWPATGPLKFPDLVPLSQKPGDRVDSYVAFADASGRLLIPEASAGIQQVSPERWRSDELALPTGLNASVFHILQNSWALQFQRGDEPDSTAGGMWLPHVTNADITCVASSDGSVLGRAVYDLEARNATFLPLILPPGAHPLAADVDGQTVAIRQDPQHRTLVTLPTANSRRVVFLWSGSSNKVASSESPTIATPAVLESHVPTLLTVFTSDPLVDVRSPLPTAAGEAIELARLELMRRQIADQQVVVFDRNASTDRAALLTALMEFEIQARTAERAAGNVRSGGEPGNFTLSKIRDARRELAEALDAAGLDDFTRSARSRVGLATADPLPSQQSALQPPASLRLRRLGTPHWFKGEQAEPGKCVSVSLLAAKSPPAFGSTELAKIAMPLLPVLAMGLLCLLPGRHPRRLFFGLLSTIAIAAIAAGAGVSAVVVVILACALGWFAAAIS